MLLSYKSLSVCMLFFILEIVLGNFWLILCKEGWVIRGREKSSKIATTSRNQEVSVGLRVLGEPGSPLPCSSEFLPISLLISFSEEGERLGRICMIFYDAKEVAIPSYIFRFAFPSLWDLVHIH